MSIHCFTSISFSYLGRARVLGQTLRRHHPDWTLWLCITDKEPEGFNFDIANEPYDEVLFVSDLEIPNIKGWLFKHDLVEACTAVKAAVLEQLLRAGAAKVFYLDPDIAVLNSLDPLVEMLDHASVLLTPHQVTADSEAQAIIDNEVCSLSHGTYNLGFVSVKNDASGCAFSRWWFDRCMHFCFDERENGLFVDQKWCDLVPALFDKVKIVRDPGYNVASWNLSRRRISITGEGQMLVNGAHILRFYHFTKLGSAGETMTRRYAGDNIEAYELWAWYRRKVEEGTDGRIPRGWWHYATYTNGKRISRGERVIYRSRGDLQEAFPDPYDAVGYYDWCRRQGPLEHPEILKKSAV